MLLCGSWGELLSLLWPSPGGCHRLGRPPVAASWEGIHRTQPGETPLVLISGCHPPSRVSAAAASQRYCPGRRPFTNPPLPCGCCSPTSFGAPLVATAALSKLTSRRPAAAFRIFSQHPRQPARRTLQTTVSMVRVHRRPPHHNCWYVQRCPPRFIYTDRTRRGNMV